MRTLFASRIAQRAFGLLSVGCLAGCNAVFDIEKPSDNILEAGVPQSVAPDGGSFEPGDFDGGSGEQTSALWPNWSMPNPASQGLPNAQAYDTTKRGIVLDEVTHLEWQADVDSDDRNWRDAVDYCVALSLDGGGFRLPTRIELLSLIDFTEAPPSIDTGAFANTPATYFWTSSTFVGNRSIAWLVNFGTGSGFVSSSELSTSYPVRCVRPNRTK